MKVKTAFVFSFFALSLVNTCADTDEFYTVEIVDGVRYVHNIKPLWGDEPKVGLEFVQKIGGLDATDENFQFNKPKDFQIDNSENIYILDTYDYRIQKFDSMGDYSFTIGRKGQGPAEFGLVFDFVIDENGNIYVFDIQQRRTLVIDFSGREKRRFEYQLDAKAFSKNAPHFRILPSKTIVRQNTIPRPPSNNIGKSPPLIALFSIFDLDGNLISTFGEAKDYDDYLMNRRLSYSNFIEIDNEGNLYVAHEGQKIIEKYDSNMDLIMKFDRPLNFDETLTKKVSVFKDPQGRTEMDLEQLIYNRISDGIAIDNKNRIWVKTFAMKSGQSNRSSLFEYNIFDSDGRLLWTIPNDALPYANVLHIFNDRLYLMDNIVEMCIYECKIIEK